MSFDYNKWEEALRPKVEAHEFTFEPAAWDEMDKLLDQQAGGSQAPKDNPPPASGRLTAWLLGGSVLIILGLLSWWMVNTADEEKPSLSSFQVTTTLEEVASENQINPENAPSIAEAGSTTNPRFNQMLPANVHQRKETVSELQSAVNSAEALPEQVQLFDRSAAYLTPRLVRQNTIPLLPTLSVENVAEPLLEVGKRKRDRRTLYPDVIDRY